MKKTTTQIVTEVGKQFSYPAMIDDLFFMSQASLGNCLSLENKALFPKHIYIDLKLYTDGEGTSNLAEWLLVSCAVKQQRTL